jgi:hypothetical protein
VLSYGARVEQERLQHNRNVGACFLFVSYCLCIPLSTSKPNDGHLRKEMQIIRRAADTRTLNSNKGQSGTLGHKPLSLPTNHSLAPTAFPCGHRTGPVFADGGPPSHVTIRLPHTADHGQCVRSAQQTAHSLECAHWKRDIGQRVTAGDGLCCMFLRLSGLTVAGTTCPAPV